MKHILLTTIAAVVLVGCGESQQSAPAPEAKPEQPTAKAPDISIHEAAKEGNIEAVKQHITAGVDVYAKNSYGQPPFFLAAYRDHKEIVELLIAKGADVNAREDSGLTSLDQAIARKNNETANILRKHSGKSGAVYSIHFAAAFGNIEEAKRQLAAGANVNAKDKRGMTPLHKAVTQSLRRLVHNIRHADLKIIELLVAEGADVNTKDDEGRTPLDFAIHYPEIINLLRKHGGKTAEELKAEGK